MERGPVRPDDGGRRGPEGPDDGGRRGPEAPDGDQPPTEREWHGHHIVTEDDLAAAFEGEGEAVRRGRFWRRFRHGVVLVLLVLLLVAGLVGAWLVSTGRVVVPGWGPAVEPSADPAAGSPAPTGGAPACPTGSQRYLDPSQVTVNVYNATGLRGLANRAARDLEERGFRVGEIGNATLRSPGIVGAVVSGEGGRAQALTLQRHVRNTMYVADPQRTTDSVDLIVGTGYRQLVRADAVEESNGRLTCAVRQ